MATKPAATKSKTKAKADEADDSGAVKGKKKAAAAAPAPEPPPVVAKPAPTKPWVKRHLRAPIEIRVEITARSQSFTTTSRNIAIGGISFESQQQFSVGDSVNVILYIPVKKDLELLKAASEIVWVQDFGGSWMCGAAFRKFAPGDERRLREWLIESVRQQKAGLAGLPIEPEEDDDDE